MRGLRVYVMVDKSGSMEGAIERAKSCLAKFVQGFPLGRVHVSVFNTAGREVVIKHASAAGVEQAFRGHSAGGGTDYGAGIQALMHHRPSEDEDTLFFFVGDQQAPGFAATVKRSGLRPVAFAMLTVAAAHGAGRCVEETALELGIPCFNVEEATFEDPYAVTRTLRRLIASTPVERAVAQRKRSLLEEILQTELLKKPVWAA
jgi:hypothetical protein